MALTENEKIMSETIAVQAIRIEQLKRMLRRIHDIEDHMFALKGFNVKILKKEIEEIL